MGLEYCQAECNNGYSCTLIKDHLGIYHLSLSSDGSVMARWAKEVCALKDSNSEVYCSLYKGHRYRHEAYEYDNVAASMLRAWGGIEEFNEGITDYDNLPDATYEETRRLDNWDKLK